MSCFSMQLLSRLPKENLKLFYQINEINIFLINIRSLLRATNMNYKYLINIAGIDAIQIWDLLLLKHFIDKYTLKKICV
jgi:hypothetical protein